MSLVSAIPGTADALASPPTFTISADRWHTTAQALLAAGGTVFEWLSAVDRGDHVDVALHVRDSGEGVIVMAPVETGGRIASVRDVWAGAAWHERETAEMFGITFQGHDTTRLLLQHLPDVMNPLVRATPLERRVQTPWPGTVEPGQTEQEKARRARRGPQLPPGVRPEWLDPTPTAQTDPQ
jgi:NADH-quinone oxidoreductase subunit C